MAFAVSTWACVCIVIRSQRRSLWCPMTSPMYQQAAPQMPSESMTQAQAGKALAKSKKRAGTSESLHMVLFLGGLNYGRHVGDGLGLAVGQVARLDDQAGTVLADLRAVRGHVHGMPAAGYSDVASSGQSADDGTDHVLDPIPPAGRCRLLGLFNVVFIYVHICYLLVVKCLKNATAARLVIVNSG
uniref:Uncharacterized protein n=1 Tax=Myoviridae sp. ctZYN8 TaxID=2825128 RepID=A0A8S5UA71_9CAUD|nr:MAG TPA: hypothetical protein [Myoviridae sp. ctZYN8]